MVEIQIDRCRETGGWEVYVDGSAKAEFPTRAEAEAWAAAREAEELWPTGRCRCGKLERNCDC